MGLPDADAMTRLGRLGKQHISCRAWAQWLLLGHRRPRWCRSLATSFGSPPCLVAGMAYLVAIPAFLAVLLPLKPGHAASRHDER